jgi:hypothetical protein
MFCCREQVLLLLLLLFLTSVFSTDIPTGLNVCCEREEPSFRGKLHGKSNLCVLIDGS